MKIHTICAIFIFVTSTLQNINSKFLLVRLVEGERKLGRIPEIPGKCKLFLKIKGHGDKLKGLYVVSRM